MIGLLLVVGLGSGPPVLPDLPAERAAKARAQEQERLEAQAKEESRSQAEVKGEGPPPLLQPDEGSALVPAMPVDSAKSVSPERARPHRPVSATQLRAAAPTLSLIHI